MMLRMRLFNWWHFDRPYRDLKVRWMQEAYQNQFMLRSEEKWGRFLNSLTFPEFCAFICATQDEEPDEGDEDGEVECRLGFLP